MSGKCAGITPALFVRELQWRVRVRLRAAALRETFTPKKNFFVAQVENKQYLCTENSADHVPNTVRLHSRYRGYDRQKFPDSAKDHGGY